MVTGVAEGFERRLCIDFDATLFPWGPLFNWESEPLPGAVEAMRALADAGYSLYIFSSRMSQEWLDNVGHTREEHEGYMRFLLKKWGIPYDGIAYDKVPAHAYVDDRAIEFRGNWSEIVDRLAVKEKKAA